VHVILVTKGATIGERSTSFFFHRKRRYISSIRDNSRCLDSKIVSLTYKAHERVLSLVTASHTKNPSTFKTIYHNN